MLKVLTEYELAFWKRNLTCRDAGKFRLKRENYYRRTMDVLPQEYQDGKRVLDVGSGPLGGVFNVRLYDEMIAVDPLWEHYEKHDLADTPKGVERVTGFAQDFKCTPPPDLIWCCDCLDHVGDLSAGLNHIMGQLANGGRFCLQHYARPSSVPDTSHVTPSDSCDVRRCLGDWECLYWKEIHKPPRYTEVYGVWSK